MGDLLGIFWLLVLKRQVQKFSLKDAAVKKLVGRMLFWKRFMKRFSEW